MSFLRGSLIAAMGKGTDIDHQKPDSAWCSFSRRKMCDPFDKKPERRKCHVNVVAFDNPGARAALPKLHANRNVETVVLATSRSTAVIVHVHHLSGTLLLLSPLATSLSVYDQYHLSSACTFSP